MVSFDYATIFDQFSLCVCWGGGGRGGLSNDESVLISKCWQVCPYQY